MVQKKYRISALRIRLSILLLLLIVIILFQSIQGWGDFYALSLYPSIAFLLSSLSNIFPFAIGDLFILFSIIGLIIYPFIALRRGRRWKIILCREVEYLAWIYVWFYIAWGLNYSQRGLLERLDIQQSQPNEESFKQFAEDYVSDLNASYQDIVDEINDVPTWKKEIDRQILMKDIRNGYRSISHELAIHPPFITKPKVKNMMFSPLSSMVGVSGSMAPFFCEFTVNSDVLPLNYPATYTHEMAHQLGITNEAEANFYAYQVCIRSQNKYIRFSGYNSILPYTLGNARSILNEKQYRDLYETINPEIILLAKVNSEYWREKYFPPLGKIQSRIYNAYLKSNKISSGTKNYSEVIGLLISIQENIAK